MGNKGWQPIETAPKDGTAVLTYFARMVWTDQNDKPCDLGPLRDHVERCQVGWYEGGRWFYAGTGHDMHEDWNDPAFLPTHWMPLPEPPQ